MKVITEQWLRAMILTLYPTWFRWKCPSYPPVSFAFAALYIPHGSDESAWCGQGKSAGAGFISHMVQMKGIVANARLRKCWPLYPTWFRWKLTKADARTTKRITFISHMVQMKGCFYIDKNNTNITLYPTWFRWKSYSLQQLSGIYSLYIPHGSDERIIEQWFRARMRTLYPTWFRWKSEPFYVLDCQPVSFISHMVQMKESFLWLLEYHRHYFISHMVQMKASFVSTSVDLSESLYPTWFRWKIAKFECASARWSALYPTWFRWKFFLLGVACAAAFALYPTWFRWKTNCSAGWTALIITFISHMVQMKESRKCCAGCRSCAFISHMVQMKELLLQLSARS